VICLKNVKNVYTEYKHDKLDLELQEICLFRNGKYNKLTYPIFKYTVT
jgi:hypothetical protein